jgi:hypothetical protein
MQLLERGPTVTVLSTSDKFISDIEYIHEQMFKTVPLNIYHNAGSVNQSNLAWTMSVMRLSDNVFVDLDTCSELGLTASLILDCNTVFISTGNKRSGIVKLFNSMKDGYTIYESADEYLQIMIEQFNNRY